jgi:predicted nucleic acid-binding protein
MAEGGKPGESEPGRRTPLGFRRGEAEAIALAIEYGADLFLVDERRGRRMASAAGLKVMGLLGVLAGAKRAGLLAKVKPVLDELIQVARFWIEPKLYQAVLEELDET